MVRTRLQLFQIRVSLVYQNTTQGAATGRHSYPRAGPVDATGTQSPSEDALPEGSSLSWLHLALTLVQQGQHVAERRLALG